MINRKAEISILHFKKYIVKKKFTDAFGKILLKGMILEAIQTFSHTEYIEFSSSIPPYPSYVLLHSDIPCILKSIRSRKGNIEVIL